jgi:tetratricopeptide (TPR) repeat protein
MSEFLIDSGITSHFFVDPAGPCSVPAHSTAVFVRTHKWDTKVESLIVKLSKAARNYALYLIYDIRDEAIEEVDASHFNRLGLTVIAVSEKISEGLGFYKKGSGLVFYHCGDIALCCALRLVPDYKNYIMLDWDLDFCQGHDDFIADFIAKWTGEEQPADFVGLRVHNCTWGLWYEAAARIFPNKFCTYAFFPFIALSRSLLALVYSQRLLHALGGPTGLDLINGEMFVPSLATAAGFKTSDLLEYAPGAYDHSVSLFSFENKVGWPLSAMAHFRTSVALAHPVYTDAEFVARTKSRYLKDGHKDVEGLLRYLKAPEWEFVDDSLKDALRQAAGDDLDLETIVCSVPDAGDESVSQTIAPATKNPAGVSLMPTVISRPRLDELYSAAREQERQGNWAGAEEAWQKCLALKDDVWWAHVALSKALSQQSKLEAADAVLHVATSKFPDEPQVFAALAQSAQERRLLREAAVLWEEVIMRFPQSWVGYRGKFLLLVQSGQSEEADAMLVSAAANFGTDEGALHDLARLAERRREWGRAETLWRRFIAINEMPPWAHRGLARALSEQGDFSRSYEVLERAMKLCPADMGLSIELALVSERQENWQQAAERWRNVAATWPEAPLEGILGEAHALRRLQMFDAADALVTEALSRHSGSPALWEALGLNAVAREDWQGAVVRFEEAQRRFPAETRFHSRIFAVRLRIADAGGMPTTGPAARPAADAVTAADRDLVLAFESLGGGGHGCEFGIFQRDVGAEPLGLLRWADIYQDQLCQALETNLAGIGEAEFTNLFVPSSDKPEYWTTDTRYHMAMRCFVLVEEVPIERMRKQVLARLKFLRGKLLEDLRLGEKIFVYKNMKRNLTEPELDRLYNAVRQYGRNTLLYIRYADSENRSGSVRVDRVGLMIGYVDHFSHSPDTDRFIGHATKTFLEICRKARAIWEDDQSGLK